MNALCYACFEKYDNGLDMCPHCGYEEGDGPNEASHLAPGCMLKGTYLIGKVLGYGGFGVTYLGWNNVLEQKVAIKEYLPSEFSTRIPGQTQVTVFNGEKSEQFYDGVEKFVDEANRLAQFRNTDGIVRIYESFRENNTAYIVMEYLDGQTLTKYLEKTGQLPADEAVRLLTPIIQSLQFVHAQGIVHRDIAPDNIMVTKGGQMKLIDFGAARYATTSRSRSLTVLIKPGYSPEEQYRSRGDQGAWTDVYAVGATMYRMITGQTPHEAMERRAFFESKKKDVLAPVTKFTKQVSENQETAILNAMNVRIEDRTPNMAAFEKELSSRDAVKRRSGNIRKIDMLKWPLWMKIITPLAACAIIALSVLWSVGVIGPQAPHLDIDKPDYKSMRLTQVPHVESNEKGIAEKRLNEADLRCLINGTEYSNLIQANMVLKQDIRGGSIVAENTVIHLIISGGMETRTLPDVTGMNYLDSVQALESLGFVVRTEFEFSPVFAEAAVISQSGAEGSELGIGETITLIVSKGIDPNEKIEQVATSVPDFIGMNYKEAQNEARNVGLLLSVQSREYSSTFEKDVVMGQNIPAGSEIMSGNTIELTISLGIEIIRVADVQYKTEAEARKLLEDQGLRVTISYAENNSVASGLVISQSPAAQRSVDPNTTVALVVSTGPKSDVFVPNVVNMDEASALSSLSDRGLSVTVNYETNDTVAKDRVIRQSIVANTAVSKGTRITITVSGGANLINVSNVIGQTESAARNTLTAQGLRVSTSESYHDSIASGSVISQTPAAGTMQRKDTTIILTISKGRDVITSISIKTAPSKTTYNVGESLNTSGLSLTVTYESGKSESISSGLSCSPTTFSTKGTQSVTVSYGGKSAQFSITVNAVMFNVSFDSAEGSSVSPRTVESGTAVGALPAPTKAGHNLIGWFTTAGTQVTTNTTIMENTTFMARWELKPWSGWSESSPPANAFNVESRVQFRSRDLGSWGPWSGWSATNPGSANSTMQVESGTEWRSRIRDWGAWGAWGAWGTTNPGASNDTMQVESGTEWRSRTRDWGAWGAWSDWSATNPGGNTETREVETRYVEATYKTVYQYYHYCKPGGYYANYQPGDYVLHVIETDKAPYDNNSDGRTVNGNVPYWIFSACSSGQNKWFPGTSYTGYWWTPYPKQVVATPAHSQWRFRTRTLGAWGEWSGWSTINPGATNEGRETEQRTVWRTRTRDWGPWGSWSDWSTINPGGASNTLEVDTRTVWRTSTRSWGAWSDWVMTDPGENETKQVERTTQFRYIPN